MIGLDTNVLVRIFVEDDAVQTACAKELVRRAEAERARLYVSHVVVCELAWVLGRRYGRSRQEVADAIDVVLALEQVELDDARRLRSALEAFRAGRGDFADYLIRECALEDGKSAVATFDASLLGEPGFVHPDPRKWDDGVSVREKPPRYRRSR